MGCYLGSEPGQRWAVDLGPTITPAEYVSEFSHVLRAVTVGPEQDCTGDPLGGPSPASGLPEPAVHVFARIVRTQPNDPGAHRLLGIAHLCQGNLKAAAKHFETALAILRREAASGATLRGAIRVQYETAHVRLVLVPLNLRLGRRHAARTPVAEALRTL